jgi:Fur family transcriptional regulator, ferric uptake regulator
LPKFSISENGSILKTTRNTVARTKILEVINHSNAALSHSEIYAALHDACNRVTVYRVLDRLMDEGLVHKAVNIDGVVKYAACHDCETLHNHNHLHFSCEKCKTITCLDDVEPSFSLPDNYQVNEVNFSITGICPDCRN